MKKFISSILLFLLILTGCNNASFKNGNGSKDNPYLIYNVKDFLNFGGQHIHSKDNFKGKHFKLMEDLNLSGLSIMPIGLNHIASFDGHFDGNNHTIKNVNISTPNGRVGLFGHLGKGASVKNLTLENIDYKATTTSSYYAYCGGIAGVLEYDASIENCHVTGKIAAKYGLKDDENKYKNYVGGIVGTSFGSIRNCSVKVDIIGDNAGGIVGNTNALDFGYNNVLDSTIYGKTTAGGIVATIDNANFNGIEVYALNIQNTTIEGQSSVGGIIGACTGAVNVSGCFANVNIKSNENTINIGSSIGKLQKVYGSSSLNIENSLIKADLKIISSNCNLGIIGGTHGSYSSTNCIFDVSIDGDCNSVNVDESETILDDSKIFMPLNSDFRKYWNCENDEFDNTKLFETITMPKNWIEIKNNWFYVKQPLEILSNLDGKGTENEPFLIKNKDDFSYLFVSKDKYYFKLLNDFDLDNHKILKFLVNITANIDGNNKTIKNSPNILRNLINADIKNLNIEIIGNTKNFVIFNRISNSTLENVNINCIWQNDLPEDKTSYFYFIYKGFESTFKNVTTNLEINPLAKLCFYTFYTLSMSNISDLNINAILSNTTNCSFFTFKNEHINLGFKNMNIKLVTIEDCSVHFSDFSFPLTEEHLKVYQNEILIYPAN